MLIDEIREKGLIVFPVGDDDPLGDVGTTEYYAPGRRIVRYSPVEAAEFVAPFKGKCFFIQNVVDFVLSFGRPLTPQDIPNIRPQFEEMWFEFSSPISGARIGVALTVVENRNQDGELTLYTPYFVQLHNSDTPYLGVLNGEFEIDLGGKFIKERIFDLNLAEVSSEQQWRGYQKVMAENFASLRSKDPFEFGKNYFEMEKIAVSLNTTMAFMAIALMHCKNVTTPSVVPAEKIQRRRVDSNRPPLVTYKVLNIHPMQKVLKAASDAEIAAGREGGLKVAMHMCRGHFKTFTAERPLLGKHVGTFFWQPQVRGNRERGEVIKDYAVHAPKKVKND